MEGLNIATVFTTKTHQVIGSRYEGHFYESVELLLNDFKNDVDLQFGNYGDTLEMFTVIATKDGNTETRTFQGELDKDEIYEFTENVIK